MTRIMWSALLAGVACAGCQSPQFPTLSDWKNNSFSSRPTENGGESVSPWNRQRNDKTRQRRPLDEGFLAETRTRDLNLRPTSDLQDGHAAYRDGRLKNAKSLYLAVLRDDPKNAEAHHRLATIADRDRDFRTASRHYAAALESNPKNAELLSDIGWSGFLQGQYPKSESSLKQALKIDPKNKRAMHNLAWLYGHQNQRDRAYSLFLRTGSEQHARTMMAQLDASVARNRVDSVSGRNAGPDSRSTLQAPVPRSKFSASRDRRSHSGNEVARDVRRRMDRAAELSIARRQQTNRLSDSGAGTGADSRQVGYRNRIGDPQGLTGSTLRSVRRPGDDRSGGSIASDRNSIRDRRQYRDARYPQRPASDETLNDRMREIDIAANRRHLSESPYRTGNPRYATEPSRLATNRSSRSRSGTDRTEYWLPEDPGVIHSHDSGSSSQTRAVQPAIRRKSVRRDGSFDDRNIQRATSGPVDPVHREALRLGHNTGVGGVPFPMPDRRARITSPLRSPQKADYRDGRNSGSGSSSSPRHRNRSAIIDFWPPSKQRNPESTDSSPVGTYGRTTAASNDFNRRNMRSGPVIRPRTERRINSRNASPDPTRRRFSTGFSQPGDYSGN